MTLLWTLLRALLLRHATLIAENLALRQQLAVLRRSVRRPRLRRRDRLFNERYLRRIVSDYLAYYHQARPHLSLHRNSPVPRAVESAGMGPVVGEAIVGGLHHCYRRVA